MRTYRSQLSLLSIILIAIVLSACKEKQTTQPTPEPTKATLSPGEVVVETDSSITLRDFETFIDSLHISILSANYDKCYFWIEVEPDSVNAATVELARLYPLLTEITQEKYPFADSNSSKRYLLAVYKSGHDASDTSEGVAAVERLGMQVKRIVVRPREPEISTVLSVPMGEELKWIEELKQYPFIKYASAIYTVPG